MSWNGSGTFNRTYSWVADRNAGLNISASRMDTDTSDISSNGFGNCLTRDGQGSATSNLPMGGNRHTGVGAGAARTDYARLDQAQDGVTLNWTITGATGTDAYTAAYTPAITALVDGQLACVRFISANSTATPTLAVNGLTARTITREGGGALQVGDIAGNLFEGILRYNLANTRWELLNPNTIKAAQIPSATISYAKVQNVAASRLLGNPTGSPAAPSEISLGAGLVFSGTTIKTTAATTPTVQIFNSGAAATYTTPAGCTWIRVRAIGGGGQGGSGAAGTAGNGGTTTFNSVNALGGNGGSPRAASTGGAGGTGGSGGTGTATVRVAGTNGGAGTNDGGADSAGTGGNGGNGFYFGGGGGINSGAPTANSGGGGGASQGSTAGTGGGGGGGSGEYIEIIIGSPAATYTYTVGAGGTGGSGTGTTGAAGRIVVEENYS